MRKTEYWQKLYERNIAIAAYLDQGRNIEFVMQRFKLSVAQAYRIAERYDANGIGGIVPGSRARRTPQGTSQTVIDVVCALRDEFGYSADRLWDHLNEHGEKLRIELDDIPTPRTLHRILLHHDKIEKPPKYQRRPIVDYYNTRHAGYPNHILECDLKCDHFVQQQRVNFFGALEQFSRLVSGSIYKEQVVENCCQSLITYIYQHGTPEIAKSDNGATYIGGENSPQFGLFTRLCLYLGIEQIFIPLRQPRWNIFIERFFRTWDEEFFEKELFTGWRSFLQKNGGFLQHYNGQRKHQSIGKLTPHEHFTRHLPQPRFPKIKQDALWKMIERHDIPLVDGRVSFIRRVQPDGTIRIKTQTYRIGEALINKHVKATILVQARERKFDIHFQYKDMKLSKNKYCI